MRNDGHPFASHHYYLIPYLTKLHVRYKSSKYYCVKVKNGSSTPFGAMCVTISQNRNIWPISLDIVTTDNRNVLCLVWDVGLSYDQVLEFTSGILKNTSFSNNLFIRLQLLTFLCQAFLFSRMY